MYSSYVVAAGLDLAGKIAAALLVVRTRVSLSLYLDCSDLQWETKISWIDQPWVSPIQFYFVIIKLFFSLLFLIFFLRYHTSFSSLNISLKVLLPCLAIFSLLFTIFYRLRQFLKMFRFFYIYLVKSLAMTIGSLI